MRPPITPPTTLPTGCGLGDAEGPAGFGAELEPDGLVDFGVSAFSSSSASCDSPLGSPLVSTRSGAFPPLLPAWAAGSVETATILASAAGIALAAERVQAANNGVEQIGDSAKAAEAAATQDAGQQLEHAGEGILPLELRMWSRSPAHGVQGRAVGRVCCVNRR